MGARASAPSADRAHTTHYQQRPPISLPNVVAFLSWISLMRPTNSPEPPRSGKFFPKNHFTQDLSPLNKRAAATAGLLPIANCELIIVHTQPGEVTTIRGTTDTMVEISPHLSTMLHTSPAG